MPSDVVAGITLAAYAIPVSLAYAGLADLPWYACDRLQSCQIKDGGIVGGAIAGEAAAKLWC